MKQAHVNPEEAVKIHKDIDSRYSVAIHWGTFILTDEPVDEPVDEEPDEEPKEESLSRLDL